MATPLEVINSQEKTDPTTKKAKNPIDLVQDASPYTGGLRSFGDSKYLQNFTADANPEQIKAANQGYLDELGNAIVQSVGGFALQIPEAAGYLAQVPRDIVDTIKGSETKIGNDWSEFFQKANESLKQDIVPIYQGDNSGHWHEWLNSNLPSIAESLSLFLPAKGVTMGLGKLGKTLGGLKAAKRIGLVAEDLKFADAVAGATFSRQAESTMEEIETYQRLYQEGINKGLQDEEAKKAAKEAANETYWKNWPLVVNDILQFGLANKSFESLSRAKSTEEALQLLTKGTTMGKVLTSMGLEGSEEGIQFIASEESSRNTAIKHNIREEDYKSYPERMMDYVSNPDFWTGVTFGALGGALFEGVGSKIEDRLVDQTKITNSFQKSVLEKASAIYQKDPIQFAKSQDVDNAQIILNAVRFQRADEAERLFQSIKDVDINSIPEENRQDAKEAARKAEIALGDLKAVEQEYNSFKKDPTNIKTSKEIEAFTLANRLEFRSNQRIANELKTQVDNNLASIAQDRTLLSPELLLLEGLTKRSILINEYKDSNQIDKDIINDNIKQLDSHIDLQYKALEGAGKTKPEVDRLLSSINKSTIAQKLSEKLKYDLKAQQNNKNYDQLQTTKGKEEVEKDINDYKEKTNNADYKKLVDSITPVSTLDNYRQNLEQAKKLGKDKKFESDMNTFLSNLKQIAPAFDPANPEGSLEQRYKDNNYLKESESNNLYNMMLTSGGIPEGATFNNALIAQQYKDNPQFAKRVDKFFEVKNVVNKKENIKKQPILEKEPLKETKSVETNSKVWNSWDLQGIQFEDLDITKPSNSNLAKKINWKFLNQGGLAPKSNLHFEYDFNDAFNKTANKNNALIELVYYKDGNINNKQSENRFIVGALTAYNEKRQFQNVQDAQDLKNLREELFKRVQNSTSKNGYINLGLTTSVNEVRGGRIWNTPNYNNPLEVLRADQSLVLAITRLTRVAGADVIAYFDSNGSEYQDKIQSKTPDTATAGKVFMLVSDAGNNIVPIELYTRKVKEIEGMLLVLRDMITSIKDVKDTEAKKQLLDNINEDIYIIDLAFNNGKYYITTGDAFNPTVNELTEEQLDPFLSNLIIQIDVSKINTSDYNQKIANTNLISTDINPFTHFHSAKVVINNPLKLKGNLEVKGITPEPTSNKQTKTTNGRFEIKGIESAEIYIGDKNPKFSLLKEESEFTPIKIEEVKSWFSKNLPQVPVDIVDNLIEVNKHGQYAWGVFQNAAIQLYKGSPKGTEYHEAFHTVFNMFLSNKEKESILNEQEIINKNKPWTKRLFPNRKIDSESSLINTEDIFKLPQEELGKYFQEYNSPFFEETIPISQIAPNQKEIKAEYISSGEQVLPFVYKVSDNKYIALDGHHRIAQAIIDGKEFIQVRLKYIQKSDTLLALEEQLAEDFAKYVQQQEGIEPKLGYNSRSFFRKLWEAIKTLFTPNRLTIDALFNRINNEYYKDSKIKKSKFNGSRYKVKNVDPFTVKRNINLINFHFFDVLNKFKEKNNLQDLSDIDTLKTISSNPDEAVYQVYARVYNGLVNKVKDFVETEPDIANQLYEIIDQFLPVNENGEVTGRGDYYVLALRNLSKFGLIIKSNKPLTLSYDSNEESEFYEQVEENNYNVSAIEIDPKQSLKLEVKKLLRQTVAYRLNENNEFVPDTDKFGFYRFVEFDNLYNTLEQELSEIYGVDQMMDKLGKIASRKYEVYGILDKLQKNEQLKTQFFTSLPKQEINFINIQQDIQKKYNPLYGQNETITNFKIYNANRTRSYQILIDKWYNNLSNPSQNNIIDKDHNIDKEKATKYLNEYNELVKGIQKKRLATQQDSEAISKVLRNFGIDINPNTLQLHFEDSKYIKKGKLIQNTAYENYINLLEGNGSIRNIVNSIAAGNNPYKGIETESSSINSIAKSIARYEDNLHQSVVNIGGKNYYSYNLPTFISKKFSELKDKANVDNYLNNWWFKHNKWLQDLSIDHNLRDLFNFYSLGELKMSNDDKGTTFFDMIDSQLDITDINMFWNSDRDFAYYRTPILSDGAQAPYISFKKYLEGEVIDALYDLALAEKERINAVTNSDIEIKSFSEKGKEFVFLPIFNHNGIDIADEVAAKEAINSWLKDELEIEKKRLIDNNVLNEKGLFENNISTKTKSRNTLLQRYFYNKVLANAMITQITSVDLAAYKNYGDFQKRNGQIFKFTKMLDTKATWNGTTTGEFYKSIYLKDNIIDNNKLSNIVENLLLENGYKEREAKTRSALFHNINQTDGFTYYTLDRYKKIKIGYGEWNNRYEEAYQKAKKGIAWDKDYELFFEGIKPFHYQHELINNTAFIIPVQHKNAEFPLLPAFAKGNKELTKLLKFAENNNIDNILFNSAVKVGEYGSTTIDKLEEGVIHIMDNKYWGTQVETPQHFQDTDNLLGSQIKKLIFGDIPDTSTFFNGKYTKQELFNIYQRLLVDNVKEGYETISGEFQDFDKIQKLILDQVIERNLGVDFEEQFKNVDGKFNLPAYLPGTAKKVEPIFSSLIRKEVTKQKINGAALPLMSNFGYSDKVKIVYDEKTGALEHYEVMLPWWTKDYFPVDSKGNVDFDLIKDQAPELLNLVGYRIPTEHKYSMKKLKVVGFTPPMMGGVCILPSEITTIAGEDFDWDKAYVMIPNHTFENGKLKKVGYSLDNKDLNKKQRDNAIIDIIGEILSHPDMSSQNLNPGGFQTLINDAEMIGDISEQTGRVGNPILPRTQIDYFKINTNGANLIGTAAITNTMRSVLQYTDIKFNEDYTFKFNGKKETKLNKVYNFAGTLISRDMTEYLAAFVDNVKNPVAGTLNLNNYTFDVGSAIVGLGFGLQTSDYFINQPVIKELTKQYFQNGASRMSDVTAYKNIITILKKKIKDPIEAKIYNFDLEKLQLQIITAGKGLTKLDELEAIKQLEVLYTFRKYKQAARSLSTLTLASRADIGGVGQNMASTQVSLNRIDKALEDKNLEGVAQLFKGDNYPLIKESSELLQKSQDELLGKYFPYNNLGYKKLYDNFEENKGDSLTIDELNYINNLSVSYYLTGFDFFKTEDKQKFITKFPDHFFKQVKELGLDQYDLVKFLKYTAIGDSLVPLIEFTSNIQISNEQRENIKRSWEAMMNSDNAAIKKLGIDLAKYSFYTTAFSYKFNGISHFLPISFYEVIQDSNGVSFRDYLYKLMDDTKQENFFHDFSDQIYRNRLYYPSLVKTVKLENITNGIRKYDKLTSISFSEQEVKDFALDNANYIKIFAKNGDINIYKFAGITSLSDKIYNLQDNLGTDFITELDYNNAQLESVIPGNIHNIPKDGYYETKEEDNKFNQLEDSNIESINTKLNSLLEERLSSWGIKLEYIKDFESRLDNNVVAVADITNKIIKVSKDRENKNTLPEEVGHFVEAYSRGNEFHTKLMELVTRTQEYKDNSSKYIDIYKDETKVRQEIIGQLIGKSFIKEVENKSLPEQFFRLFKRLWDNFTKLFKSRDNITLQNEVEQITGKIAKDVLNNNFTPSTKIKVGGKFYELNTKVEEKAKKILEDGIDSIYKKIKLYEKTGSKEFTKNREELLNTLKNDYNQKAYELGLTNYINNAKEELIKVVERYNKIENKKFETPEEKRDILDALRGINNYVNGFSNTLEEIAETKLFAGTSIRTALAEANDITKELKGQYYSIGKGILVDVLKEFSSHPSLDIKNALDILEKDISWTQRWLDAMAEASDPILKILDNIVKDAKQRSRLQTLDFRHEVVTLQKKLESTGIPSTSFVAERNFDGKITGRYVTEYNEGEFDKQQGEFWKKLDKKYPKERTLTFSEKKARAKEARQWYLENTQERKDKKAFVEAKKAEFKANYPVNIAQEKFQEWFNENTSIDYITGEFQARRELLIPSEKYKSTQYIDIQKNSVMKEYWNFIVNQIESNDQSVDSQYRLNGFLPQVGKDFQDRLFVYDKEGKKRLKNVSGLAKETKGAIVDTFSINEKDTEFGLTDENNSPINFVPVYFTKRLSNPEQMSLDVTSSMVAYTYSMNDFKEMSKIVGVLEFTKDAFAERKVLTGSNDYVTLMSDKIVNGKKAKDRTIKGTESNAYDRLSDYLNMIVYGQQAKKGDWAKLVDFANKFTSLNSLALNLYSGISNVTVGNAMIRMESVSKEFINSKDYAWANKTYTQLLPGNLANIGQRLKTDKLSLWIDHMDAMQNYDKEYKDIEADRNTLFSKLMQTSSLYFLNHAGEHMLQSRMSLALAHNTRVKDLLGKEYSLWDAFDVEDGKLKLKSGLKKVGGTTDTSLFKKEEDGQDLTERDINRFINRQNFINKRMHGIYNNVDKSAVQQYALGRLALMFRKYIKPGINRRFEKLTYNEEGEAWTEGYYTTASNFFKNMYKELKEGQFSLAKNWSSLSTREKANFMRLATEWAYIIGAAVLFNVLANLSDDDDDNAYLAFGAYEAGRLYSELRFFTSIQEALRIMKSPAPAVYQIQKIIRFIEVWNWNKEITKGKYKGLNQGERNLLEITPFVGTYVNFRTPSEQLKFFTNNGLGVL